MPTYTAAPERLYLMQVAALPPPDNTPAVCYLIQTSDGANLLIDSGLPNPASRKRRAYPHVTSHSSCTGAVIANKEMFS